MDTIPYIVIAVLAVAGLAVVISKKRFGTED